MSERKIVLPAKPVHGLASVIQAIPTIDTNAYASGDRVGTVMTLTNAALQPGGIVTLDSVSILDLSKQSAQFDILFFSASPTIASADNAAIDITDAQMLANWIGSVTVFETYIALAANSHVSKAPIGLRLKASSTSSDIFALAVIRSAATYAAAVDLIFKFGFSQDT